MDAYLFRFSRADGESMHSYISRENEVYGRMCQALARLGADPDSDNLMMAGWAKETYDEHVSQSSNWHGYGWSWHTSAAAADDDVLDWDPDEDLGRQSATSRGLPSTGSVERARAGDSWKEDPWWAEGTRSW